MSSLNEPTATEHTISRDRNDTALNSRPSLSPDIRDTQVARGRTLSRQYAQIYTDESDIQSNQQRDDSVQSDRTVTPESYAADVRNSRSRNPFRADSSAQQSASDLESGVEDLRRREWLDR